MTTDRAHMEQTLIAVTARLRAAGFIAHYEYPGYIAISQLGPQYPAGSIIAAGWSVDNVSVHIQTGEGDVLASWSYPFHDVDRMTEMLLNLATRFGAIRE